MKKSSLKLTIAGLIVAVFTATVLCCCPQMAAAMPAVSQNDHCAIHIKNDSQAKCCHHQKSSPPDDCQCRKITSIFQSPTFDSKIFPKISLHQFQSILNVSLSSKKSSPIGNLVQSQSPPGLSNPLYIQLRNLRI